MAGQFVFVGGDIILNVPIVANKQWVKFELEQPKMTDVTQEMILDYMIKKGGVVKNVDLVRHFKKYLQVDKKGTGTRLTGSRSPQR